ncbi:conserved Plasmodium protein, unknown function [Plasmodium knowlesi strain H]|uniref:Uncharacterized protein n=3 Tax=Plasmodium knowlesi TaxID=5850 RepID=A0A5K1V2J2_PLAKH|nr:conserved Plasmodium protein, unknown function [Plasmodium knowlesi strain H]OTN67555.1 Uncharacterized protein PKNOH_S06415200 [Plasmodium knowlesi]CAA9987426.1 conserved Plasmodium protein, unknown function [Plasmodium knowlesi strain H]SBO23269.1 conserved Plasmodium protein, unknown function [Plasmodium knowlesi strain H]SBO24233.1 conserved Plasmodium protein, unknown function [Plasmodium knowlesi strain H]VVS76900.1 conserved Plasmodium protein, unknown function [Plasmodium knowlesi s|eukprot:XP_002258427.1 hypothetical protein, conserved in Plasmodium species [Plasmodium knowlesi strain H]
MKNCNSETKLIYRTLSDKFFVINKPVKWTLTRKKTERAEEGGGGLGPTGTPSPLLSRNSDKTKSVEVTDYLNEKYRSNTYRRKSFLNHIKNLSNAEKNAFLYTNSALYLYNDFNFNLGGNSTENNHKDKFVEKYYVESLLNCETNGDVYYPYKLPIYMSGLVICCRDLLIYKKFLQMIRENKLVRKYRCLVHDPFVFVENNKVRFSQEGGYNYRNRRGLIPPMEEPSNTHPYGYTRKNDEENKIDPIKATHFLKSLQAQKEASDMFPYYNFFADNPYSSSYCYRLGDLTIDEWKRRVNSTKCSIKKEGDSKHKCKTPHRGGRVTARDEKTLNFDNFISAFLKRSRPVKCLNRVLFSLLHSDEKTMSESDEYDLGRENEPGVNLPVGKREQEKDKHGGSFVNRTNGRHFHYDVQIPNECLSKDGKIKFPLSLYFNEGNFFTFDKKLENNSVPISMIYRMENYRDYLKRNSKTLFKKENVNLFLDKNCNVFIIEFVFLDNPKPDFIRFFFSELNTPIINDSIFDRNSFKRDAIGEVLLVHPEDSHADSSPRVGGSPFFDVDTNMDIVVEQVDGVESNTYHFEKRDRKIKEYLLKARDPDVNAFTIPGVGVTSQASEQKVQKINPSNFIIQEMHPSGRHDNGGHTYPHKSGEKMNISSGNTNLCLELFELQFLDPINGDHVKIENSLPRAWL